MKNEMLFHELESGLAEIPLLDVHTHLDTDHLSARGLHDVFLYHMVISDLVSAGCPNQSRLSEEPNESEILNRLEQALPYYKYIENTSTFWGMKIILKDLYDWTEPVDNINWRKLHDLIKEKSTDKDWPRKILKKANIKRACTELWRRKDGSADDIFQYVLEWAFFTRAQWGVNDIPLLELENAWNQPGPGSPLPVTMSGNRPKLEKTIKNIDDVKAAIEYYVSKIPFDEVIATAQHISTDIDYLQVTEEQMNRALKNRVNASEIDRNIYANFILEMFLTELEKHADKIVYQFSFGAEPLPFETGSKLKQDTIFQIADIVARHPKLKFQIFLSSAFSNQSICTLARELPNLSVSGYWWHNFFPTFIKQVISERLDMLAVNKQIGFFSDAYCVDWAYAKVILVKKQLAWILADKVSQGQYTITKALEIAEKILFHTPQSLLGMIPNL